MPCRTQQKSHPNPLCKWEAWWELSVQRYNIIFESPNIIGENLLPQRLFLPAGRESHRRNIHFRERSEQRLDFLLHVIAWGNRIQEVLDDAQVEIDAERVRAQGYPRQWHHVWHRGADGVLLVPYTSMMAT